MTTRHTSLFFLGGMQGQSKYELERRIHMDRINTTGWKRMDFVNFYSGTWGVPVIPIHENKTPILDKWTPYQTAMPTQGELDQWFVKRRAWGPAWQRDRHCVSLLLCVQDASSPRCHRVLEPSPTEHYKVLC